HSEFRGPGPGARPFLFSYGHEPKRVGLSFLSRPDKSGRGRRSLPACGRQGSNPTPATIPNFEGRAQAPGPSCFRTAMSLKESGCHFYLGPISSIKGEVKKKHSCAGWNFSCFSAHVMEQDLF